MNWLICGTIPFANFPLSYNSWSLNMKKNEQMLENQDSPKGILPIQISSFDEKCENHTLTINSETQNLDINRGTSALIASTLVGLHAYQKDAQNTHCTLTCLLVGDTGTGDGSKKLYEYLAHTILPHNFFDGITFHYLFPDVDWHNRVLMAIEEQEYRLQKKPILVADAGFMYVAKMSGYADKYDIFTPDIGEMAFLADEYAPHPFYTRGFLLAKEHDIPDLLDHANAHQNIPKNLIIKGETDYIVINGVITEKIKNPSVPTMEAIGGTGDLVTGLLTAELMQKHNIQTAMCNATQKARNIAKIINPSPATQIGEILTKALYANFNEA